MDHHRSGPSTVLISSARTIARGDHVYEDDGLAETDRHLTVRGLAVVSRCRYASLDVGRKRHTSDHQPVLAPVWGPVALRISSTALGPVRAEHAVNEDGLSGGDIECLVNVIGSIVICS